MLKLKSEFIWVICRGKFEKPGTVSMKFVEIPDLGFSLDKENQLKVWCPLNDLQYVVIWEEHPKVTIMVNRDYFQVTNNQLKIKPEYASHFKQSNDREETLSEEKIINFQSNIDDGTSGVEVSPSVYDVETNKEPVKTREVNAEVNAEVNHVVNADIDAKGDWTDAEVDHVVDQVVNRVVDSAGELQNTYYQSNGNEKTHNQPNEDENEKTLQGPETHYLHTIRQSTPNQLHNTERQSNENEESHNRPIETERENPSNDTELPNQQPLPTYSENESQGAHSDGLFEDDILLSEVEDTQSSEDLPGKFKIKFYNEEIHIRLNNVTKIFPVQKHEQRWNPTIFVAPKSQRERELVFKSFLSPFRLNHLFEMKEDLLKGFFFIRIEDCLRENQLNNLRTYWMSETGMTFPKLGYVLMDCENTTTSGLTGKFKKFKIIIFNQKFKDWLCAVLI